MCGDTIFPSVILLRDATLPRNFYSGMPKKPGGQIPHDTELQTELHVQTELYKLSFKTYKSSCESSFRTSFELNLLHSRATVVAAGSKPKINLHPQSQTLPPSSFEWIHYGEALGNCGNEATTRLMEHAAKSPNQDRFSAKFVCEK